MPHTIKLFFAIFCWILSSSVFANAPESTPATTEAAEPIAAEVLQDMRDLQSAISRDLQRIESAQGELKGFTEFRINNKAIALRAHITKLMEQPDQNKTFLTPIIQQQIEFVGDIGNYLAQDVKRIKSKLGSDNDNQLMLDIVRREYEIVQYFQAQLETLNWAEQLNIDVSKRKAAFVREIQLYGDSLKSQVSFTQLKLKQASATVKDAGANVSAEQTTAMLTFKNRLSQLSQSLDIVAQLMDQVGLETAEIKQTLFSISGAITQDVLNVDVASNLIGRWLAAAKHQAFDNGPKLIFKLFIFVVILFLGHLIGNMTKKLVRKAVGNSKLKFSKLLQDFFVSLSSKAVFTVALLIALSQLGFELGPLLAGFGIAGVIIGFALQDTLSNFASGMMILIYRPYDVGDLITAAGVTGRVGNMSLVSTTIKTLDNQRLIIPNNKIWGDTINNITVEHQRRVDMVFGIGYGDDIEHAERVLHDIINQHPSILNSPAPTIKLHTLNSSSVDFIVRPWVKPGDYWDVYWDITREVKMRFDAEGISIPFPQRDVHVYQHNDNPVSD